MRKSVACLCGDVQFTVWLDRREQVGLLSCVKADHYSLLLDSRDYWDDVIQEGRPRQVRCRCGSPIFEVELEYEFRDAGDDVKAIDIGIKCVECGHAWVASTFEINYGPTEVLLTKPLDPCPEPWLKAKRTTLCGLWLPSDVVELIHYLGNQQGVRCYFAGRQQGPLQLSPQEVEAALADATFFHLFFSVRDIAFPERLIDCWKRLPVIYMGSPFHMVYTTGLGELYSLYYADELFVEGHVVPQEPEILDLAKRLRVWLRDRFPSQGNNRIYHNPVEYERLKGGL